MKSRIILYFILLFVCVGIDAKKIELGEDIIYEGEVLKGVPNGQGTIILRGKYLSTGMSTVEYAPYKIEGIFDGNTIYDARLYDCNYFYNHRVIESGTFRYEVKKSGKLTFVLEINGNETIAFQKKNKWWKELSSYSGSITENPVNGKAKRKKIKYSNTILYQGFAIDNTTMGNGSLIVNSLVSKGLEIVNVSGNFNDGKVDDATIVVNGEISIKADKLTYWINTYKDVESVNLFMQGCELKTLYGLSITEIESLEFSCYRSTKGKEWCLFTNNSATPSIIQSGVITSNFLPISKDLSLINATESDITKQRIIFALEKIKIDADESMNVKILSANETVLTSGIVIKHGSGAAYNYPNGNTISLNDDGSIERCMVVLNGGVVEKQSDGNLCVKYDNGDVFISQTACGIKTTSFIGTCNSVSELDIVDGVLSHPNKTKDTYSNGEVIGTLYPLSDGGSFIKMKNGRDKLVFADGRKFEASCASGLIAHKDYSVNNTTSDYIMSTGTLTSAEGHRTTYENGNVIVKNIADIFAYPTDREIGSSLYLNHRCYDGSMKKNKAKELQCLINNDVAGYFNIDGVETELQKKGFSQTVEYRSTYLPRMQAERTNLLNDEYMVRLPIKANFEDLKDFSFDLKSGRFEFEIRDAEHSEINGNYSDFHFRFYEYLCLTYPHSLVKTTICRNWFNQMLYIHNAQTCKVSESDALKVENNINSCEMIWVFKFEKIKDYYIYGKTTRIYIANKRTGEIYCDLSNSL